MMSKSRRAAFTIIELLVSVAIVVLLTSLLLPSLGRAREMGRRAACLSNLKSLGAGIQVYASQYLDQVPLGISYRPNDGNWGAADWRDTSYLYWGDSGNQVISNGNQVNPAARSDFLGLGRLYQTNIVMPQGSYNCPSAIARQALPRNYFEMQGQWPIYDQRNQAGLIPVGGTLPTPTPFTFPCSKGTYSRRPAPPPDNQTWGSDIGVAWRMNIPGQNFIPELYMEKKQRYPKLMELPSNALAADLAAGEVYIDAVHGDGMNVVYSDGGARWVPRVAMKNKSTGQSHLAPKATYPFFDHSGDHVRQYAIWLWQDFDRN